MSSVGRKIAIGKRKTVTTSPTCWFVVIAIVVVMTSSFVSTVTDAARVLSQPDRVYLTRAVPGRLDCPADANPPVTLVAWTKDGRPVQLARRIISNLDTSVLKRPSVTSSGAGSSPSDNSRVSLAGDGALLFAAVSSEDAGRYTCTPHSSLGVGQSSVPVQVLVKGNDSLLF